MDSHQNVSINIIDPSDQVEDNALSISELAYVNFLAAKNSLQQQSYQDAVLSLQEAIRLYSQIENKTSEEYNNLIECYRLKLGVSQFQNQILLDINQKALKKLDETKAFRKEVAEEIKAISEESVKFVNTVTLSLQQLSSNLNTQIQELGNRPQPTIMEHIANEIRNKFTAISQYSFTSIANSFFSLFSNWSSNNTPDSPGLDSPSSDNSLKNA